MLRDTTFHLKNSFRFLFNITLVQIIIDIVEFGTLFLALFFKVKHIGFVIAII